MATDSNRLQDEADAEYLEGVIELTQAQFEEVKAGVGVDVHFDAVAAAFRKNPSASAWRALKRAMLYLQAARNGTKQLAGYFTGPAAFRDEA